MFPAITTQSSEEQRLASLQHYGVLSFFREDVFGELVRLTARVFSLPISLFNLVDADYVRTEAHYGVPPATLQPRAEALCSTVVTQNQIVVYHDLAAMPQTAADAVRIQAALATQIRFYAAAPVRLTSQHSLGALCLLDRQPRNFSPQEQHVLQTLADTVSQAIVVRHHCRTTPELGDTHWQRLHAQLHDEVQALEALVRYLLLRYGTLVPVHEEVLHLVRRRLADMRTLLQSKTPR